MIFIFFVVSKLCFEYRTCFPQGLLKAWVGRGEYDFSKPCFPTWLAVSTLK
jgi:hypothetical protein